MYELILVWFGVYLCGYCCLTFLNGCFECYQRIESVMNDEWLLLIIDPLLINIFQGVSLNCKGNSA